MLITSASSHWVGSASIVSPMRVAALLVLLGSPLFAAEKPIRHTDGFRGVWYMNQPQNDRFKYKYSGGFATYPQQHVPIAIYVPEANKTFFCYGGKTGEENRISNMVSYYDHTTGTRPAPPQH